MGTTGETEGGREGNGTSAAGNVPPASPRARATRSSFATVTQDLQRVSLHRVVDLEGKNNGSLEFDIEFVPSKLLSRAMITPGIYYMEERGPDTKVYADRHDGALPPVVDSNVRLSSIAPPPMHPRWTTDVVATPPRLLWGDIYAAICAAKYCIYTAGWSTSNDQCLLHGTALQEALAKGKYPPRFLELLRAKAAEGLTVNREKWVDNSSNCAVQGMGWSDVSRLRSVVGGDLSAILKGRCEDVHCVLHHKYIVCDAVRPGRPGRELYAFVGGDSEEVRSFCTNNVVQQGNIHTHRVTCISSSALSAPARIRTRLPASAGRNLLR